MDPATKIGAVVAFAGIAIALIDLFIAEDLKAMPRWVRLSIALTSMVMLVGGAATVALWPTPIPGLGPRLEIYKIEQPKSATPPLSVTYHFRNIGDRAAQSITYWAGIGLASGPITSKQEDSNFDYMHQKITPPDPNRTSEYEVGDASGFNTAFDKNIKQRQLDDFNSHKSPSAAYYVMILVEYLDPATGRLVFTEYCGFDQSDAEHMCYGHNRIKIVQ